MKYKKCSLVLKTKIHASRSEKFSNNFPYPTIWPSLRPQPHSMLNPRTIAWKTKILKRIRREVSIPIIYSGGAGKLSHVLEACEYADGIALANILHYGKTKICTLKEELKKN